GRVAVEQVQRLRQRRLQPYLAGADRLARGPAERRQEVGADAAVRDLHGPGALRQAGELVLRLRHGGDAVQQRLRPDAADAGVAEVTRVTSVAVVRLRRQLIGPRQADVAHQLLEVVLVLGEALAQLLQQLRVGRRIADAHVVHLVDDADAE